MNLAHSCGSLEIIILIVRKIVLYPNSGVSEIEEIPNKPSVNGDAIAGPLASQQGAILLVANWFIVRQTPVATVRFYLGYKLEIYCLIYQY